MRIAVVEPRSPGVHIFTAFKIPRLGSVLLGTILDRAGHRVTVHAEEVAPVDFPALTRADLVLVSTITPTAPRAYSLCRRLRKEGVKTVLGGPHVTFLPEEGLEHADFVVRGEGETAVLPLVDAVARGAGFDRVPGLAYREGARVVKNPPAPLLCDLDRNPHPDFRLVQGWPGKGLIRTVLPVQTSRGCPFRCAFCSVTGMFGHRLRCRSVPNVLAELASLGDAGDHIFFYDDNFTADRARARALLDGMIRHRVGKEWSGQVRTDVARDPGLLDRMKESGCTHLYIGFETLDPVTLRRVRKGQSRADAERALRELTVRRGIDVHGMFVIGFERDTPESIRATVDWALEHGVKTAQFLILTPLPGSAYFEEAKRSGRILIEDWGLYDAHHVVTRPAAMTPLELQWAQVKAHARFYSWRVLLRHALRLDLRNARIGLYAKGVTRDWLRSNGYFMKLAELLSMESRGRALQVRLVPTFDEFQPAPG